MAHAMASCSLWQPHGDMLLMRHTVDHTCALAMPSLHDHEHPDHPTKACRCEWTCARHHQVIVTGWAAVCLCPQRCSLQVLPRGYLQGAAHGDRVCFDLVTTCSLLPVPKAAVPPPCSMACAFTSTASKHSRIHSRMHAASSACLFGCAALA